MSAGLTAELDVEPLAVIRASRALGRLFVEFVLPGDRPGDLTVERFVPRGLVQRRRDRKISKERMGGSGRLDTAMGAVSMGA